MLTELAARLHQPLYEHCALVWQAVFAQLDGRHGDAEAATVQAVAIAEQMRIPDARQQVAQEVAFRIQAAPSSKHDPGGEQRADRDRPTVPAGP